MKFELNNVHMYCYRLTIIDKHHTYQAIIEASASDNNGMLVWLEDFDFPKEMLDEYQQAIKEYLTRLNYQCILESEHRIE